MHLTVGTVERYGRFEVRGELGRGGMGRVLSAWDPELEREVAIKVVVDRHVDPVLLRRFLAEARITSQLEHPNIMPVYDMGRTEQGQVWFAMKRIEGRSLRQVIASLRDGDPEARRHWTRHRLLAAFVDVCQAVAYAHERGVLHRDLKPENVMTGRFGEVLVMDWGLARVLGVPEERARRVSDGPVDGATTYGEAVGTPGYMSPEQGAGDLDKMDQRSDVWSLGALLYELVTLEPAWPGTSAFSLVLAPMSSLPQPPRLRAPNLAIPEGLERICLRALAPEPADRFQSAVALADAVDAFLEGSQRRAEAAKQLVEAEQRWADYLDLDRVHQELLERERTLAETVPAWATMQDEKQELVAIRERLQQLDLERASRLSRVVAAGERALSHAADDPAIRSFLARVYFSQFEQAEREGSRGQATFYADRVRDYDAGPLTRRLVEPGRLVLDTDPPGATVLAARVVQKGLVWPLELPEPLGTTPLDLPLAIGSYVLTLRRAGLRDVSYPVLITRGRVWDAGVVPMYSDEAIGGDFVYVPAGPFRVGGDPSLRTQFPAGERHEPAFLISRVCVTCAEYALFLNDLDPDEAAARVPSGERRRADEAADPWWPRVDGVWVVPERDEDGDAWDPRWPVFAISWHDAVAYAAWRSRRDGATYTLPTETQWEKAGRGVDGRLFPWGDLFDTALCHIAGSRPGRTLPAPVGLSPTDVSVYGVRDLSGTIREWCAETGFEGDAQRRPVRGGTWNSASRIARLANRFGYEAWVRRAEMGIRLVKAVPPREG